MYKNDCAFVNSEVSETTKAIKPYSNMKFSSRPLTFLFWLDITSIMCRSSVRSKFRIYGNRA